MLQQNGFRVRIVALEFFDIADGRAAERVDGLVGVTHHAQLGRLRTIRVHSAVDMSSHQLADQHVLGVVGVLVLVNQDVPEFAAIELRDLRELLQHGHGLADQIVEVQGVGGAQPALVLAVHVGHDLRKIPAQLPILAAGGEVGHRLFGRDELVLQIGDRGGEQPWRIALDVQAHIATDHLQQPP
ncbi:Uncharacterised protein [Mycobacteroides abscessus]|nr:Uncharacterised protein [Mycobacteroides abscessus]